MPQKRSRRRSPLFIGLAASLVAAGCVAPPAASAPKADDRTPPLAAMSMVGFWAGEEIDSDAGPQRSGPENYHRTAYRGALTPQVWDVLRRNRVPLYLNVRYGRDFGPVPPGVDSDTTSLVQHANALGVPVIGWLTVPFEDGYWAHEGNPERVTEAVRSWVDWVESAQLRFESVVLDQEFSWQNLQTYLTNVSADGPLPELSAWLETNIDPARQCKALRSYRDLLSWAQERGVKVDAALAPMVVDDLRDGRLALQDALGIAGSVPGYAQTYLMAYRSAGAEFGFDPGSAYPAFYYEETRKHFGDAGQVSLGIGGQAPYDVLGPLVSDVRMLAGLGAKRIPIYSLESTVAVFGADGLETIIEAADDPMEGAELVAAAAPTSMSDHVRDMSYQMDATAVELTARKAQQRATPPQPNSWPIGC
jgi:hypothetical protein